MGKEWKFDCEIALLNPLRIGNKCPIIRWPKIRKNKTKQKKQQQQGEKQQRI